MTTCPLRYIRLVRGGITQKHPHQQNLVILSHFFSAKGSLIHPQSKFDCAPGGSLITMVFLLSADGEVIALDQKYDQEHTGLTACQKEEITKTTIVVLRGYFS